jgi:hypothetical protein
VGHEIQLNVSPPDDVDIKYSYTINKMIKIIVTIILVSTFFILFFNPIMMELQNKKETKSEKEVSTTAGFIEDTRDAFIIPMYPAQIMDRDITGKVKSIHGDIGTFVAYSTVPDEHWLSGFPHKKTKFVDTESREAKLKRRKAELAMYSEE